MALKYRTERIDRRTGTRLARRYAGMAFPQYDDLPKPTKRPQKPTRTSTLTITINGIEWTATATSQAEAVEAICRAVEAERAGK